MTDATPAAPTLPTDALPAFALERTPHGRLLLRLKGRGPGEGEEVTPVRAFPLAAPDEGVSLVGTDGHERLWIPRLSALPAAERSLIEQDLAEREFMPALQRIVEVSTFSTPSTWTVETDRGETRFVLRGEEDIRRLADHALLVTDGQGIHYRIADLRALDRGSRRLLERFL
jgi:hypothetical protein